jgi:hypothetical protein
MELREIANRKGFAPNEENLFLLPDRLSAGASSLQNDDPAV